MKKINFLLFALSSFLFLLVSCQSNNSNLTDNRISITVANTCKNYCARIFIDGEEVAPDFISPVPAGKTLSFNEEKNRLAFPVDVRVDLHEMTDDTHYYVAVAKSFNKENYQFSLPYRYKITIRDTGFEISKSN